MDMCIPERALPGAAHWVTLALVLQRAQAAQAAWRQGEPRAALPESSTGDVRLGVSLERQRLVHPVCPQTARLK